MPQRYTFQTIYVSAMAPNVSVMTPNVSATTSNISATTRTVVLNAGEFLTDSEGTAERFDLGYCCGSSRGRFVGYHTLFTKLKI